MPMRQVHLDFHTSPWIGDLCADWNAEEFAGTMARARVQSVNLFARCHHGWCYFPTSVGRPHPALQGRDLLGEQIEALRSRNIAVAVYTSVGWDEENARLHPDWRQIDKDGFFLGEEPKGAKRGRPGSWKYMNFIHPEYRAHLRAHLAEFIGRYPTITGVWLDILLFGQDACWSESARAFRRRYALTGQDAHSQFRFIRLAQQDFMEEFTRFIRSLRPDLTIFYNNTPERCVDARYGLQSQTEQQTHLEIESLPSGFWGYHHFPRNGRQAMMMEKQFLGMTGRFHKMWGDFGGIKPVPALEYECFRTQAMGGACCVGDQLPPRGRLEPAAYRLIGEVFHGVEAAEAFYDGSSPCPQIGIVTPNYPGCDSVLADLVEEGLNLLCEECHYDACFLDETSSLEALALILVPEYARLPNALAEKIRVFWERGGSLLIIGNGGYAMETPDHWALPFLGVCPGPRATEEPVYWRTRVDFCSELSDSDRVFYRPGWLWNCEALTTSAILIDRVWPYFTRSDLRYCSHFQTPGRAEADSLHPAAFAGERWIVLADPIGEEYRRSGLPSIRLAFAACLNRLIGPPIAGQGLPSTVTVYPRKRGNDLLLTLLHYIPVRKALEIDCIDERMSLTGLRLCVPGYAGRPRVYAQHLVDHGHGSPTCLSSLIPGPQTEPPLQESDNGEQGYLLPSAQGRLLLLLPGYFSS